jgi:hypothetical protein
MTGLPEGSGGKTHLSWHPSSASLSHRILGLQKSLWNGLPAHPHPVSVDSERCPQLEGSGLAETQSTSSPLFLNPEGQGSVLVAQKGRPWGQGEKEEEEKDCYLSIQIYL